MNAYDKANMLYDKHHEHVLRKLHDKLTADIAISGTVISSYCENVHEVSQHEYGYAKAHHHEEYLGEIFKTSMGWPGFTHNLNDEIDKMSRSLAQGRGDKACFHLTCLNYLVSQLPPVHKDRYHRRIMNSSLHCRPTKRMTPQKLEHLIFKVQQKKQSKERF